MWFENHILLIMIMNKITLKGKWEIKVFCKRRKTQQQYEWIGDNAKWNLKYILEKYIDLEWCMKLFLLSLLVVKLVSL
jgi:hypothetical protein